jgi:5-methylcytosine-specific restriction endonuclease McrA
MPHKDPEKQKEYSKNYHEKNKEKRKYLYKKWYLAHREYYGRKPCPDCGKIISKGAMRCGHCAKTGINNPCYGKPGSMQGKKHTKATLRKMSLAANNHKSDCQCISCRSKRGEYMTPEIKQKLRMMHLGKKHTKETIKKMTKRKHAPDCICVTCLAKRHELTEEIRKKMSSAQKGKRRGPLASNWKGGVSELSHLLRTSSDYKEWRKTVFERDHYTCAVCNKYGKRICVHHIIPLKVAPLFRYDLSNGITLCTDCHKNIHALGAPINIGRGEWKAMQD